MKTSLKKIFIIIFVLIIAGGGFYLYNGYQKIEDLAVESKKDEVKTYITSQMSGVLLPQDFSTKDKNHQMAVFEKFWKKIQSTEIPRIKVWDTSQTIIWSDYTDIIGQNYLDNTELTEALLGEMEIEFVEAEKTSEYFSVRQYGELMEVYTPITDAGGKVVGVIEIYQHSDVLVEEVSKEFKKTAIPTVVVLVLILAVLFVVFRFSSRTKTV